jgi:hypothetical protein
MLKQEKENKENAGKATANSKTTFSSFGKIPFGS